MSDPPTGRRWTPERRAEQARHWTPERRAEQAERMRQRHADPAFAAAHAERMRQRNADPAFVARNAERAREMQADPNFAAARDARGSALFKKLHADPIWKEKQARALSERMKLKYADRKPSEKRLENIEVKKNMAGYSKISHERKPDRDALIAADHGEGLSLAEIGRGYELSRERVRQIVKRMI